MKRIRVENLTYTGYFSRTSPVEKLTHFTYEFEFGKTYAVNASIGSGGWALSWILGGKRNIDRGQIFLNGDVINASQLRDISWLVRYEEVKRFGFISQSVRAQIQSGLKKNRKSLRVSEDKIKEVFLLTESRYDRKLSHLSHEAWRASCAIGFVHGKKIFCFPHMSFLRPGFVEEYGVLWLPQMFNFLTSNQCLVIFPSEVPPERTGVFDKIINI